jgi:predicted RNA-binding Zn-ribbon protein involved in translation (DUF1610 family)
MKNNTATVKCDLCGWKKNIHFDDTKNWYKKPCPKCGKGEIVNLAEMIFLATVKAALILSGAIDPEAKNRKRMILDTAKSREVK